MTVTLSLSEPYAFEQVILNKYNPWLSCNGPCDSELPLVLFDADQSPDAVHVVGLLVVVQERVTLEPSFTVMGLSRPFTLISTVGGGGGAFTPTNTEAVSLPVIFEQVSV